MLSCSDGLLVSSVIEQLTWINTCRQAASDIDVGELVYEPPRSGPTLWEIGIPDRTASEYYVPDPDPQYINPLYINHPDRSVMFKAI